MIKIKLTSANKSILLKALAPYYYREKALGHSTEKPGRLILKINSLPADKKATFSTEEIFLMRTAINRLRNERLSKGQYTDAADDMLLKLFWHKIKAKSALQKYIAMRFLVYPKEFAKPRPRNAPPGSFRLAGRKPRGTGCSNPPLLLPHKIRA